MSTTDFSGVDTALANEPLDCLAVAPHPDDAELCCGGLLAALSARGYRVGILDLSRGELASQGTVEQRAGEAEVAAELLGLVHRDNLGLPDGGIDGRDAEQLRLLVSALRALRPELVLAPYERARHPDHEQAAELTRRAVFNAGLRRYEAAQLPAFRPRALLHYEMRVELTAPSFVVDISAHAETKRAAIEAHASQIRADPGAAVATAGGQRVGTLVSSSSTLGLVDARDRRYGAMIGAAHGEPYWSREVLAVDDPLALFRATPGPAALFPGGR
jgi:bacillithiol biosynthesis deacetylase BshB1